MYHVEGAADLRSHLDSPSPLHCFPLQAECGQGPVDLWSIFFSLIHLHRGGQQTHHFFLHRSLRILWSLPRVFTWEGVSGNKVGALAACLPRATLGLLGPPPSLRERSAISFSPYSHCSGDSAGNHAGDLCDLDSV